MQNLTKVNKIQKSLYRSIITLEILMLCYEDAEARRRLDFARERYDTLVKLTEKYENDKLSDDEKEICENQIINDCDSIYALLAEIKEEYFSIFKLITVMIINNKKDSEIEKFYENVKKTLKDYKTLSEARDYLFYHSGVVLEKFIGDLLAYVDLDDEQVARRLPVKFLEKYQTIITLSFKEWVDIFNNIKFTLKYVGNINKTKYLNLIKKYERLEVIYFILLAAHDVERLTQAVNE